jgi:prefoldin subunit 5
MSEAIKLIVGGYVKLSARKELEDLKAHLQRLASELRSLNGLPFDLNSSIRQLEEEITVVEAGLAKVNSGSGAADQIATQRAFRSRSWRELR